MSMIFCENCGRAFSEENLRKKMKIDKHCKTQHSAYCDCGECLMREIETGEIADGKKVVNSVECRAKKITEG